MENSYRINSLNGYIYIIINKYCASIGNFVKVIKPKYYRTPHLAYIYYIYQNVLDDLFDQIKYWDQ